MAIWLFALTCSAFGGFWAYTRALQEATLFWGKRLGEGNDLLPSNGMQDAITPPAQNARNVLALASLVLLPVWGVVQFGWGVGIGGFFGVVLLSAALRAAMPRADSRHFFQAIVRSLVDRRAKFARASDELRVEATDALLGKLLATFEAYEEPAAAQLREER